MPRNCWRRDTSPRVAASFEPRLRYCERVVQELLVPVGTLEVMVFEDMPLPEPVSASCTLAIVAVSAPNDWRRERIACVCEEVRPEAAVTGGTPATKTKNAVATRGTKTRTGCIRRILTRKTPRTERFAEHKERELVFNLLLEVLQIAGCRLLAAKAEGKADSESGGDDNTCEEGLHQGGCDLKLVEGREDGEGPNSIASDLAKEASGVELSGFRRPCHHTLGRLGDHCGDQEDKYGDDNLR